VADVQRLVRIERGSEIQQSQRAWVGEDASAGTSFVWEKHRAFTLDTLIRDAIVSTSEDLVLPFQSSGLDTLRANDFVRWGFPGTIHARHRRDLGSRQSSVRREQPGRSRSID
jgi:hypothetical protein